MASRRPNYVANEDDLIYPMTVTSRLQGHATVDGTRSFAARNGKVNKDNWRSPYCESLTLSRLGLGSYLGDPTVEHDRQLLEAAMACVESGAVNVIDTAINYRYMKAERSLGEVFRRLVSRGIRREELFVCTKGGFISKDGDRPEFAEHNLVKLLQNGQISEDDIVGNVHCMHPNYLANQFELSLENLGLATLDLYYLHNAAEVQLPLVGQKIFFDRLAQAFEFLETMRRAGKLRYYGLATWTCFRSPQGEDGIHLDLEAVVKLAEHVGGKEHGFRFVQVPLNAIMLEAYSKIWQLVDSVKYQADNEAIAVKLGIPLSMLPPRSPGSKSPVSLLRAARMLGVNVMGSASLHHGALADSILDRKFFDCDHNSARHLLFLRSIPRDTSVVSSLVGMKSPAHVVANLEVATKANVTEDTFRSFVADTAKTAALLRDRSDVDK